YFTGRPPCGISMMTLMSHGALGPTGMASMFMVRSCCRCEWGELTRVISFARLYGKRRGDHACLARADVASIRHESVRLDRPVRLRHSLVGLWPADASDSATQRLAQRGHAVCARRLDARHDPPRDAADRQPAAGP